MSDLHIEEFFRDAATTLVTLFNAFPRPVTLYVEDICGPDEPDEYGVHSHRYMGCFGAMVWLGEEQALRYQETIKQEAIDQAVLTGRCFTALLKPVPDSLDLDLPIAVRDSQASVAFQLQSALKSRDNNRVRSLMSALLDSLSS